MVRLEQLGPKQTWIGEDYIRRDLRATPRRVWVVTEEFDWKGDKTFQAKTGNRDVQWRLSRQALPDLEPLPVL